MTIVVRYVRSLRDIVLPTLVICVLLFLVGHQVISAQPDTTKRSDPRIKDNDELCLLLPIMFQQFGDSLSINTIHKRRETDRVDYSHDDSHDLCERLARRVPASYHGIDCANAAIEFINIGGRSVTVDSVPGVLPTKQHVMQIVILTTPEGGGQSRVFCRRVHDSQWCFLLYEGGEELYWQSEYYIRNSDSSYVQKTYYSSTSPDEISRMRDSALKKYDCTPIYHDGEAVDSVDTHTTGAFVEAQNQHHSTVDGVFWFIGSAIVCDRKP